jgi:predicted enzyme related to lactoylglutathione lyase
MGTRTSHAPGTLSFVDLATTDVDGAKAFYTALFGWEPEDGDAGGGAVYTMFRLGGDAVTGLMALPVDLHSAGVPPSWTSYVTVTDADATAEQVTALGGTVANPPFDVMDAGRMAVLADPQGAVFAVWQPRAAIGAERVNDIGCLTMNELATSDLGGARAFYGALFGWTFEDVDTGPGGPVMASVLLDGRLNATFTLDTTAPPHWRPYFTVESVVASLERIGELGGQTVAGPLPLPDGAFAFAVDPQGALFGLFEGEVDD